MSGNSISACGNDHPARPKKTYINIITFRLINTKMYYHKSH